MFNCCHYVSSVSTAIKQPKRNANPVHLHLSIEWKGTVAHMKDDPSVSRAFYQEILMLPGTSWPHQTYYTCATMKMRVLYNLQPTPSNLQHQHAMHAITGPFAHKQWPALATHDAPGTRADPSFRWRDNTFPGRLGTPGYKLTSPTY